MSLQTAFRTTQAALTNSAFQTATTSRNISGSNTPGYARKIALVETSANGASSATRVARATDAALQKAALASGSADQRSQVVSAALETLQSIFGDPAGESSPSARVSQLKTALLQAGSAPQDVTGLAAVVDAGQSLVGALSNASAQIQGARQQADSDMATAVAAINASLSSFEATNAGIISGQAAGRDVSNLLDRRDSLLADLAKQVGISTIPQADGGMSIYTDSGVALFQGSARSVSMEATNTFSPDVIGRAVYIDGVAVTGASATAPLKAGALAGLASVRDTTTVDLQSQVDEIAVGLISAFAQRSTSPPSVRTGLFTWPGGPALPSNGARGIGANISIDPTVLSNPTLLRDGGIGNDPAFVANSTGASTYSSQLYALSDALDTPQNFVAAGLSSRASVAGLASQSEAWFEGERQDAAAAVASANATFVQSVAALSNATGVNIDDQMSQMLDLENSYQASAKMMATIDSMYAALFNSLQVA